MTSDVFGTAALRTAVLEAWRASPARLREDANTEEDHARGYYRDRVVVELAQNAADAAARAGLPGRLLLRLERSGETYVLVAANTGSPLDAEGVASLASMRASAKRASVPGAVASDTSVATPEVAVEVPVPSVAHGVVGRFGVGFAAVRAVADEITVLSSSGAVCFSVGRTREVLEAAFAAAPALAAEVHRRDGVLPALRLPFPAAGAPPEGYDTAVVLSLRDASAVDEVRSLLAQLADPLVLALPALSEIVVEVEGLAPRRLADVASRWRVVRRSGAVAPELLVDRPVEERASRGWSLAWAVPTVDVVEVPGVVHAPTPTDEPSTLPALLLATLPLDPSRRHVAAGPLTEFIVGQAGEAYAELASLTARQGGDPLALVPGGMAAGALDAALREVALAALAATPLIPTCEGDRLLAPNRAVAIAGEVGRDRHALGALSAFVADLVVLRHGDERAARALGVELRELADVLDELPTGGDPGRWRELYSALAAPSADPLVREALGSLPVPLADGRVVRGARGTVLLERAQRGAGSTTTAGGAATGPLGILSRWGLRLVHPAATHPLLERLGAIAPDAAGLLVMPTVREAVLAVADDDDLELAEELAAAVLSLVTDALADGHVPAVATPWLGLVTLRAQDGEPTPARALVLPGSRASELLDERVLAPVAAELVERWGAPVLGAVGVRSSLVVTQVADVVTGFTPELAADQGDTDAALGAQALDGWDDFLDVLGDQLGTDLGVGDLLAVADLDAVRDEAWPGALAAIDRNPEAHRALCDRVRAAHGGSGGSARAESAPSYTAWWLRTQAPESLGLVGPFALPGAAPALARLLPPAPPSVHPLSRTMQAALGGVGEVGELEASGWAQLIEGLGPVGTPVGPALASAVWEAFTAVARSGAELGELPGVLPAITASDRIELVSGEEILVAPAPQWCQRTDLGGLLPSSPADANALAEVLDLPLATDVAAGSVSGGGHLAPVPAEVLSLVPLAPAAWLEHEDLRVDGRSVDWWVEGAGPEALVHAVHLAALARGLAWAGASWPARHAVEIVLTDPGRAVELAVEATVDPR